MKKIFICLSSLIIFSCGGGIEGDWELFNCYDRSNSGCFIIIKDGIIKNASGERYPDFFKCEYELLDDNKIRAFNCSGSNKKGKSGIWERLNKGTGYDLYSPSGTMYIPSVGFSGYTF
jgi:hypothetical protein